MTVMNIISTHSLDEFQTNLGYETWENVFNNNDNSNTFQ
jgi:hypothetical protein